MFFSKGQGKTAYEVAHRMILAHAKAWHIYNERYKWMQKGKVKILYVKGRSAL